jgi:hypothetical protein
VPCNSIATARAKVSNETFMKLLAGEPLSNLMKLYLKSQGHDNLSVSTYGGTLELRGRGLLVRIESDGDITVLRGRGLLVRIESDGDITVQGGRSGLEDDIAELIRQAGAAAVKAKVAAMFKAQTISTVYTNGNMVLELEI